MSNWTDKSGKILSKRSLWAATDVGFCICLADFQDIPNNLKQSRSLPASFFI